MRIAISGSHSLGKSTIVNEWVAKNPQFHREEEPYRALGLYGPYEILFRDASTKLHNGIQMYYNISRIYRYGKSTDDVIFDRAPVDYIAYSQYTANQGSTDIDAAFVESMVPAEDRVRVVGREWYWLPVGGISTSAMPVVQIERLLGEMTMRTLGTLERMVSRFG